MSEAGDVEGGGGDDGADADADAAAVSGDDGADAMGQAGEDLKRFMGGGAAQLAVELVELADGDG